MKRFNKVYIEISNICNLSCSFCAGTKRPKAFMSPENFSIALDKIKPYTDFIYYHVLGEPLLHPQFDRLLNTADDKGFKSCITTNGSLLSQKGNIILDFADRKSLHKISISLQAQEANEKLLPLDSYMDMVCCFAKKIEDRAVLVFRLWNEGGLNRNNEKILQRLHEYYPGEWMPHPKGLKLSAGSYLEFDSAFKWPDYNADELNADSYYCYALKDQIGILVDGTVVPCCLDSEGSLRLGNIFSDSLENILESKRAFAIRNGFKNGTAAEELCRKCGYAKRFAKL